MSRDQKLLASAFDELDEEEEPASQESQGTQATGCEEAGPEDVAQEELNRYRAVARIKLSRECPGWIPPQVALAESGDHAC